MKDESTGRAEIALTDADVEALRGSLRGRLIRPGDEAYEDRRRVWNGVIDKHPVLIAECTGAADVIAAVNFARQQKLADLG